MIRAHQFKLPKNMKRKRYQYQTTADHWISVLVLHIKEKSVKRWMKYPLKFKSIRIDACEAFFGKEVTQQTFLQWLSVAQKKKVAVLLTYNRSLNLTDKQESLNNEIEFLTLLGIKSHPKQRSENPTPLFPTQVRELKEIAFAFNNRKRIHKKPNYQE